MPDILKKLPINWDLIGNPVNWVTVVLMVMLVSATFALVNGKISSKDYDTNG